ncbi:Small-conductance mechanosensitive channel [hydrothermal vent metagenome]|uniref:Small-conductance mechanosensitive channel n=1 Tax=hydrothermal vent metagenome TaxID=652676 RepID=A0A3B1DTI5_9ZZZZ
MPRYGADGDVLDISLTTIKVRNWDNTITTIPTYALISDSFKNWRGMQQSGGRRIKRSFQIDMNSVSFCNEEMLARFEKIDLLREYIQSKRVEIEKHNHSEKKDDLKLVNDRNLTNLGCFRAYLDAYLANHPQVNQKLTLIVRQLAPGAAGLPMEIYLFSKEKAWANYEAIQADIFDHILAVIAEFDLRLFQNPSGRDFQQLSEGQKNDIIREPKSQK